MANTDHISTIHLYSVHKSSLPFLGLTPNQFHQSPEEHKHDGHTDGQVDTVEEDESEVASVWVGSGAGKGGKTGKGVSVGG